MYWMPPLAEQVFSVVTNMIVTPCCTTHALSFIFGVVSVEWSERHARYQDYL